LPPPADPLLNITVYSDNIAIESFIQGGRVAYTKGGLENQKPDGNGVRVECHTTDPAGCVIRTAEVWRLNSIWKDKEDLLAGL
jgi:hypothetical protein